MAKKVKRTSWKKIVKEQRENRKPVSYNSSNLIQGLPRRTLQDIIGMRGNAFKVIASEDNKLAHGEANKLIKAINSEFIRRYDGKIDDNGFFHWPNTNVGLQQTKVLGETCWVEEGVLGNYGYRVGITDGRPKKLRHIILNEVFVGVIPPIFEASYLREWGAPKTSKRLRKIAETIASFTRNAKRRNVKNLDVAIKEWEEDLEFLYWNYYVEHFYFSWPITKTS